jgi:hypothetical protein
MQLAPMRYTKIDGTAVSVQVASAVEAKAALKELRHKKRELKFLRVALVRRQRATRVKQQNTSPKQSRSFLRRLFAGIGWLIGSLFDLATLSRSERRARDPAEIERELHELEEMLHNIEGCILQLQGKMLAR